MAPALAYGPPESYGPPAAVPYTEFQPVDPPAPDDWKTARYAVVTTELSPAALYLNRTHEQRLFSGLGHWGLGGPTSIAYMGPGASLEAQSAPGIEIPNPGMTEPWILVWFQGARGWERWDSPWLVVLQHRPSQIVMNADGLRLTFAGEAGAIAAMPLFGYFKPPQRRQDDLMAAHGEPSQGMYTADWLGAMPYEPIQGARWWARVLRDFPLHCRETFSVDRSKDRLTLREEFTWLPIDDDWKTPALKFGPISPTLALAYGDKRFPLILHDKVVDPKVMTPYGPYLGIEGKDRFDIDFDVLKYVNETEVQQAPDLAKHPAAKPALDYVKAAMASKFPDDSGKWAVDFGESNFCWAAMSDRWYPKGLAYADPAVQANARKSLHKYYADWVLKEERFKPFKGMLLLAGPGIGTWGGYDDAGKFSSNLLIGLWSYAQYTGDWDLIRARWSLIKRLFITPLESDWKTFGRAAIAEMGDEAAPALAYARMAYKAGDVDGYAYGCYIFAREILHEFVKQNGAQYFRARQPYHTMEWMPPDVYLTNLWGDTSGWQIDGPDYPAAAGERQFNNRWIRFGDEDVARFHRDTLAKETKAELDGYVASGKSPYKAGRDDAHIAPSMERLRSLLLNESPEELAKLAPPDKWSAQPESGKVALGMSFLRTAHPVEFARLISGDGRPTPFVLGLERQVEGGFSGLVQRIAWEYKPKTGPASTAFWPIPVWLGWRPRFVHTDDPVGENWPFGESRPEGPDHPRWGQTIRLNWNTQVTTFDF